MQTQPYSQLRVSGEFLDQVIESAFGRRGRRAFARAVAAELQKPKYRKSRADERGCSHSLINQLANGETRNTHPARARAMEAVLNRPRELFALQDSCTPAGFRQSA
jgi:hypothetical protein